MSRLEMEKLAEEYLQEHGRTGGSSLKTIHAFKAGYTAALTQVRNETIQEAAKAVDALATKYNDYYCAVEKADVLAYAASEIRTLAERGES